MPRRGNLFVEITFWVCLLAILVPRIALEVAERRLSSAVRGSLENGWRLSGSGGGEQEVAVPGDLRQTGSSSLHWIYKRSIDTAELRRYERPALVLGRIGDSDSVDLSGCRIGATGINANGGQRGYWWSVLRVYEVPDRCLQSRGQQTLQVNVWKWWGSGFGIFSGPVGIGEYEELAPSARLVEALRFTTLLVFGFVLLVVSAYYGFVYFLVPVRTHNGIFAITAAFLGGFEILTSTYPFRWIDRPWFFYWFLLASAGGSAALTLRFLQVRLGALPRRFVRGFEAITIGAVIVAAVGLRPDFTYRIYLIWQAIFILGFLVAYGFVVRSWLKGKQSTNWRYLLGFSLLVLSAVHDVVITRLGAGKPYLIPYGFMAFGVAAALSLAKEYADAFLNVERQVSDRTKDLAVANEHLRSLEQMKARFFANLSHDFKTPIALAFAHVSEAKREAGVSLRGALGAAEQALNRLQGMVLDLLDTMRAESGALKFTWETVSAAAIVRTWAAPYQILCDKKGLTLSLDISVDEDLKVPMDVSKMERVFGNLMANALKFTDEGGITVGLRMDASQIYLEVSDTGPGIPVEEREKVFDRYFQGDSTSVRDHGGSGIGLSFVKETVLAQNGRVWVEGAETHGSRFVVALPLSQDVEITGEHRISEADIRTEAVKGSVDVPYPDPTPSEPRVDWPSILIVEDNPEVAQVVVHTLEDLYNIYFAKDGLEGLDQLKTRKIDCIVSDLMMPRMDGRTFLKEVKKNDRWKVIPFVCLTSMSDMEILIECLQLGANNYVTKPFHREVLRSTVATLIQNAQFREQLIAKDKMASLGLLSAGLAHEMRNPIQAAQNLLEGLRRKFERWEKMDPADLAAVQGEMRVLVDKDSIVHEAFRDIRNCVLRINNMVDAIGTYSTGSTRLTEIDLTETVQDSLKLLENKRKEKNVAVHWAADQIVKVQAFPTISQAITNILDNAIDAVPAETGEVTVTVSEEDGEVHLQVTDNGPGIPLGNQPYIFEAFFTTKGPGAGTGLGLYVAKRIVEYHRGAIRVHSEEGRGAIFTIRLKKVPDLQNRETIDFKGFPVSF
ncbi:MAG: ATP-binding protein [Pseudomonadota bacterium]